MVAHHFTLLLPIDVKCERIHIRSENPCLTDSHRTIVPLTELHTLALLNTFKDFWERLKENNNVQNTTTVTVWTDVIPQEWLRANWLQRVQISY